MSEAGTPAASTPAPAPAPAPATAPATAPSAAPTPAPPPASAATPGGPGSQDAGAPSAPSSSTKAAKTGGAGTGKKRGRKAAAAGAGDSAAGTPAASGSGGGAGTSATGGAAGATSGKKDDRPSKKEKVDGGAPGAPKERKDRQRLQRKNLFSKDCEWEARSEVALYLARLVLMFVAFRPPVPSMMYAFGDDPEPLPETVSVLEEVMVDYLVDVVSACLHRLLVHVASIWGFLPTAPPPFLLQSVQERGRTLGQLEEAQTRRPQVCTPTTTASPSTGESGGAPLPTGRHCSCEEESGHHLWQERRCDVVFGNKHLWPN